MAFNLGNDAGFYWIDGYEDISSVDILSGFGISAETKTAQAEDLIRKNKAWTFVPGYVDEGISTISVKHRKRFLAMIKRGCSTSSSPKRFPFFPLLDFLRRLLLAQVVQLSDHLRQRLAGKGGVALLKSFDHFQNGVAERVVFSLFAHFTFRCFREKSLFVRVCADGRRKGEKNALARDRGSALFYSEITDCGETGRFPLPRDP